MADLAKARELSGRLSERVRFESRSGERGIAGEAGGAWRVQFECWAQVEAVSRFEALTLRADARQPARRWRLLVRDTVAPRLEMRIRWGRELMLPTAIEVDPRLPGLILLWAEDWTD